VYIKHLLLDLKTSHISQVGRVMDSKAGGQGFISVKIYSTPKFEDHYWPILVIWLFFSSLIG
jgi:hypothetical protein